MSDNPNELKSILLNDLSSEDKIKFAEILAEKCANHDLQKIIDVGFFYPLLLSAKEC